MLFKDRVTLTSRERTEEGYLRVGAKLSRTGLQDYYRGELGLDGNPRAMAQVYRPEEEVFDAESLSSFVMKPVTDDHPADPVHLGNIKQLAIGMSGENITRDGDFVRGTLVITDADAIAKIENGVVEISLGYFVELDRTPGVTPDGRTYDAVQRKIRGNHIALVDAGRCGGECRLDDRQLVCGKACDCASCSTIRQNKESEMTHTPKAKLVDGVPVSTLEEAFEVIDRKDKLIGDSKQSLIDLRDKLLSQQKDHATQVQALEQKIAELTSAVSDAAIDKKAEERLALCIKAADHLGDNYDTDGKTNAQIAKDALVAVLGSDSVSGKSDAQCLAMFDMLSMEQKNGVSLADALTPKGRAASADNGRAEYRQNLSDAWRTAGVAAAQ